jgi:hypothetical protein
VTLDCASARPLDIASTAKTATNRRRIADMTSSLVLQGLSAGHLEKTISQPAADA